MPISFRRSVPAGAGRFAPALLMCLLSFSAAPAIGQDTPAPLTPLEKLFARFDLAVVASGSLSTTTSGIEKRDATATTTVNGVKVPDPSTLTIRPSNTVGELATLRYIAKPYVGFEFNFGNLRYTQDYTFVPPPSQTILVGGVQSGVRELTLGYVAHLPWHPFGVSPYAGVGGGTIAFHPTIGGGQGLPFQYRAAYYYNLGLEDTFPGSNFGMRLGFRQLIYLSPDFLQNYLTITRRTRTSEPIIGFFLRF